jgi:hypothetical protein
MQIADNNISDIIPAYHQIQAAETELHKKWRDPLLSVYATQRETYQAQLSEFNKRRAEFNRRIRIGIWMSSALLLLGLLVLPGLLLINELGDFRGPLFCFSPLLILGGFTGWAIIILLWIWQRDQEKPSAPSNPLKSDLFYPLIPLWKDGLIGSLPKKKPHQGATGEYHFITRLQSLDDNSYILYRTRQRPGKVVDVILVGAIGVWVFEVKHLPDLIRWRDGTWSHIQRSRRLSRRSQSETPVVEPGFDEEWQRSADDVSAAIRTQFSDLENKFPGVTTIRGGIVFTHPKGRYDIPRGCPFNWGIVPFWLEKLDMVTDQEGMDESAVMQIIQALLTKHHHNTKIDNPRSMVELADQIVMDAEGRLRDWIENN